MSLKYFIICLVCALWTILQTTFHLVFVLYSFFFSVCYTSPTDVNSIFFYLTYLYTNDCATPKFTSTASYDGNKPEAVIFNFITSLYYENDTTVQLEELVQTLLNNIEHFPTSAGYSSRTSVFLLCFLILDGAWIVSAVALLMGTCFRIKESLSLVFYGPWLIMTICISIFDATACVLFGFDIAETLTFSSWRKFVGISDGTAFSELESRDMPTFLTTSPAFAMCSVSSRFILIWIINWVCFVLVMKATISVYRETYKTEAPARPNIFIESNPQGKRADVDSSSARIRSWQLFYGAADTASVYSNRSTESGRDLNSNSKEGLDCTTPVSDILSPKNGSYFTYPDVVDSVVIEGGRQINSELRRQLPWSYTQPQGKTSGEERIELDILSRRHYRIKSDSSGSGTEL